MVIAERLITPETADGARGLKVTRGVVGIWGEGMDTEEAVSGSVCTRCWLEAGEYGFGLYGEGLGMFVLMFMFMF